VTFNANGHGPTISKYLEVRENQIIDGLTESEFGSAAGYVLDGWCQESECENEFVFHDTPIKEDITVYAKWDKQAYSVNYVLNCDGKCSATNASSYTVDGLALNAPSAWDEGHHFMGWSENTEGKEAADETAWKETVHSHYYIVDCFPAGLPCLPDYPRRSDDEDAGDKCDARESRAAAQPAGSGQARIRALF
jgi:hypothetical protein